LTGFLGDGSRRFQSLAESGKAEAGFSWSPQGNFRHEKPGFKNKESDPGRLID
jgi:hypothetical protein